MTEQEAYQLRQEGIYAALLVNVGTDNRSAMPQPLILEWDLDKLASAMHLTKDEVLTYFRDGRRISSAPSFFDIRLMDSTVSVGRGYRGGFGLTKNTSAGSGVFTGSGW